MVWDQPQLFQARCLLVNHSCVRESGDSCSSGPASPLHTAVVQSCHQSGTLELYGSTGIEWDYMALCGLIWRMLSFADAPQNVVSPCSCRLLDHSVFDWIVDTVCEDLHCLEISLMCMNWHIVETYGATYYVCTCSDDAIWNRIIHYQHTDVKRVILI